MTERIVGWEPEDLRRLEAKFGCPDCPAPMRLTQDEAGSLFYACTAFPECKSTHKAYQEGHNVGQPIGRPVPRAVRQLRSTVYELAAKRWPLPDKAAWAAFTKWSARKLKVRAAAARITVLNQDQLEHLVCLLELSVNAGETA